MQYYYSSGSFAHKARVSLRTIRYYDKIDLLKPTKVDDNGHRFYTDEDFTKLQQILTFKMLGFSLDEIKAMTISVPDKDTLQKSLSMQLSLVRMQKSQLARMEQALTEADAFLKNNEQLDMNHMVNLIHLSNARHMLQEQYKTSQNIDARVRLHKECSTNPMGWFPWVFSQCGLTQNGRVLELGCGNGALWQDNVSVIPFGTHLTLTDISEGLLEETRLLLEKELAQTVSENNITLEFTPCDCRQIPFKASQFDVVIANHLLFYLEDREQVYKEILRVLKPGGQFIASTYGPKHMQEITTLVQEFHPAITLADKELYETFGLQNGAEELAQYFSEVETRHFNDSLLVSDTELLLAYILSCHGNQNEYLLPRYQEFKEMLTRKLTRRPLHITKDAGLFVCRKSNLHRNT